MLEKLAHADSWTILLGLFVITFLLSWLLSLTWDRGKALTESEKLKVSSKKSMGFFSFLIVVLLIIIVVLILSVTRLYTAFTTHELAAVVKCLPANGYGKDAFELVYTPVLDGEMAEEQRFIILWMDQPLPKTL